MHDGTARASRPSGCGAGRFAVSPRRQAGPQVADGGQDVLTSAAVGPPCGVGAPRYGLPSAFSKTEVSSVKPTGSGMCTGLPTATRVEVR